MDLLNPEYLLFFSCAAKVNLRYLLIGGYAVNYYGYNRNTHDLDVWLAPDNTNREKFIQALICMGYSEDEVAALHGEDFTRHFTASIGGPNDRMDFLTYVHQNINFEKAEQDMIVYKLTDEVDINLVPYNFLIDMKLLARRDKDILDITQLNRIRNLK